MNSAIQPPLRVAPSGRSVSPRRTELPNAPQRTMLLGCGIAASMLYVAMDIVGTLGYSGYSYADHTFSELLAVGSPVRPLMILLSSIPYALLMAAFAAGVWKSAGARRAARITALLLLGYTVVGLITGLAFPMNTRQALAAGEGGLRNAMHPAGTAVMSLLLLAAMGFGATLAGRRFRYYTCATIIGLLLFGILTSLQAGRMTANLPTPWMGIEERVNIYATMLWMAMLAVGLRRHAGGGTGGEISS
ncbi:MAG TPA: DUF998 domain-containing protein [Candidatus Kapabacteria bacterium]|nr:DUF998 domain-containing protein [Candidatus Kapabacteria bacterium]